MIRPEKTIAKLKSGEDVKIVAIGDSLTYGWQVSKGYLDFLKEMLRKRYPKAAFQIVNKGIPGDTASGGSTGSITTSISTTRTASSWSLPSTTPSAASRRSSSAATSRR